MLRLHTLVPSLISVVALLLFPCCGNGGGSGGGGGTLPATADARLVKAVTDFTSGPLDPVVYAAPISAATEAIERGASPPEVAKEIQRLSYGEALPDQATVARYVERMRSLNGYSPWRSTSTPLTPLAAGKDAASASPLLVVFVNGIGNDLHDVERSTRSLASVLCDEYPGTEITYSYNSSSLTDEEGHFGEGIGMWLERLGSTRDDFWEAFEQLQVDAWNEYVSFYMDRPRAEEDLEGLRDLADVALAEGKKILFVAHSQGNLFVRDLLVHYARLEPWARKADRIAVLMVGSPMSAQQMTAFGVPRERLFRVTNTGDPITITSIFPDIALCEDGCEPARYMGTRPANHEFVGGYLEGPAMAGLLEKFGALVQRLGVAPPSGSQSLRASATCEDDSPRVLLRWGCTDTEQPFWLYRDDVLIRADVPPWTLSVEDPDAVTGATHTYRLSALLASGPLDRSVQVNVPDCSAPGEFAFTTAETICENGSPAVRLAWTASPGATHYRVERDGATLQTVLSASTLSFRNVTGVAAGATHAYAVTAWNANGSFATSPQGVTVSSCGSGTVPGAFSVSSATAGCTGTTTKVDVAWGASSGADSYVVLRDGSAVSSTLPSSARSWTDTGVSVGSHQYSVRAANAYGTTTTSSKSATVSSCGSSSPMERITNGSFTSGGSGWTEYGDWWIGTDGAYPYSSPGYAAGGVDTSGSAKNSATGWMYQSVAIPSSATTATLSFRYNISSNETTTSQAFDVLNVTIQSSSGSYLATVLVKSNLDKTSAGSYSSVTFDLTGYKGTTVRVNFLATTDSTLTSVFRIDNVSVMADG